MKPTELTSEDTIKLPLGTKIVTFAKDQPEYLPLPVAKTPGYDGRVVSRWTLTPEERERVRAGEDIYIDVLTFGGRLQPIAPAVGLADRRKCVVTIEIPHLADADEGAIVMEFQEALKQALALRAQQLVDRSSPF